MALIGYGSGVGKALEAAEELRRHDVAVTVADARFAKPIDAGLMAQLAAENDMLVTVEEGVLAGGFGSAVWETLNESGAGSARILRVGLPDAYVTHGKPALLHEEVGFTAATSPNGSWRRSPAAPAPPSSRPDSLNETTRRGERAVSGRRDSGEIKLHSRSLSILPTTLIDDCDIAHTSLRIREVTLRTSSSAGGGDPARAPACARVSPMGKRRLDTVLAERGLFPSRTRAAASIMAGEVKVGRGERRAAKPGEMVDEQEILTVDAPPPFVSRGGIKLANALESAAWTSPGAGPSTSAPRREGSPTACCSGEWWR